MKKIFLMVLIFLFIPSVGIAYELSGSITREGNGNYNVTLQNNNGHEYSGSAHDVGDGKLEIDVEDDNGQSYSGVVTDAGNGEYNLELQNNSSGGEASGTLTLEK